MKKFGLWSELVEWVFRKAGSSKTVTFKPGTNTAATDDVEFTLAEEVGPSSHEITTNDSTQTLQNKTIGDGSDASKALAFDTSGALTGKSTTFDLNHQDDRVLSFPDSTDTLVGEATQAALTNKDYDGGTATDLSRLTVPKDTKANLDLLTRKEGTFVYATDEEVFYYDNGVDLVRGKSDSGTIRVDYYDPVSVALPNDGLPGAPTFDGQVAIDGDQILFSNIDDKVYEISGIGVAVAYTALSLFAENSETPADCESVCFKKGDSYAEQVALYNGTDWRINDTVRYFDGANGTDYYEQSSIKSSTLTQNSTGDVFTVAVVASENWVIPFSLERDSGEKEVGVIYLTTDGTTASIAVSKTELATTELEFSADINAGNLRLRYTAVAGSNVTMKYHSTRWSDSPGGPSGTPTYTGASSTVSAAGGANEVQYRGSGGTLSGDVKFQWIGTNSAIYLNGLYYKAQESASISDAATDEVVLTLDATTYRHIIIEYSLKRGTDDRRTGRLLIVNDGTLVTISDDFIHTTDVGVVFSADISGSDVRLKATTTATGDSADIKYTMRRWTS